MSDKVFQMAKEHQVQFVAVKFTDLAGRWHHITIPAHELNESLFNPKEGIGFDGSSVTGFARVSAGDMIVIGDPETAYLDPFTAVPTLNIIGNIIDVSTNARFERDPRYVAQKAENYLKSTKVAEKSYWGPEFEFYLFDKVRYVNKSEKSFFSVDSSEAHWNMPSKRDPLGFRNPHKGGYHAVPPHDRFFDFRNHLCSTLEACGVPVKYHHHEVGGAGQLEIEVLFDTLTKMADRTMIAKNVIHNAAFEAGLTATLMPKPMYGEPGSGMHVHQFLVNGDSSLFFKADGLEKMSDLALHYLGGILKHAPALLAFTNPSTNSYRRLVPGYEAPIRASYSKGNRTAAVRIPGYLSEPKNFRYEFRPPDATMNPYLAFAAMLMAGLDGVKNKIHPGLPQDKDLFTLPETELAKIPELPTSLPAALKALQDDHEFLLEGGVFTQDLINTWIALKQKEASALNLRPHPYEYELSYDC
jgi:glutamine synthetase